MKLPLLDHPGLFVTQDFLTRNPPPPAQPERVEFSGEGLEPDYDKLGTELHRIMEAVSEPPASDGAVARALHECLKLTRREAAEMRFWHYLAAVKYPDYVSWRYFDSRTRKTNKNRYTGLLDDNALSRLWWFADLTLDPENTKPYWRTEHTATSLEFVKGIVENLFGGNRCLVGRLAEMLFNGSGKPSDTLVQTMFTRLNVLLVSVAVDALSEAEIAGIVQQLYSNASK